MTQDEIIRMAREVGAIKRYWGEGKEGFAFETDEQLERFAALFAANEAEKWKAENKRDYENWKTAAEKAAECEREACAKVCDDLHHWAASCCAKDIRARGE